MFDISKAGCSIRRLVRSFPIAGLLVVLLWSKVLLAQDSPRKVTAKTAPSYPEMAKKLRLHGKVKVEAVVSARGSVISASMVGGNPVFEKSAVDAVKQWKFEPADKDSKTVVVLEFGSEE